MKKDVKYHGYKLLCVEGVVQKNGDIHNDVWSRKRGYDSAEVKNVQFYVRKSIKEIY